MKYSTATRFTSSSGSGTAPALRGGASLLGLLLAFGCSTAHDLDAPGASGGTAGEPSESTADGGSAAAVAELDAECMQEIADSSDGLPKHLRCTGLYSNITKQLVAKDVHAYTPGIVLWSDGADKHRWIHLPAGEKIDASTSTEWMFPVGTKLFKEFKVGDTRVETRLFQKVRDDKWVRTTYAWNIGQTDGVRSGGGDIIVNGAKYHIPGTRECDQCHQGRKDRILGFEAIGLGVATTDQTGMTLEKLVDQKLISPAPANMHLEIADDGTGKAAEIVGWIHMNCGVSCHNDNPGSSAHSTKLRLRLSPDELDGRSATEYAAVNNTVDVAATTVRWAGQKRIVPGSPDDSLLYKLVGSRAGKNDQMPPIATFVVDQPHLAMLHDWTASMPPAADAMATQ